MIFILADFYAFWLCYAFVMRFFVLVKCYIVYKTVIQGVCPVCEFKKSHAVAIYWKQQVGSKIPQKVQQKSKLETIRNSSVLFSLSLDHLM